MLTPSNEREELIVKLQKDPDFTFKVVLKEEDYVGLCAGWFRVVRFRNNSNQPSQGSFYNCRMISAEGIHSLVQRQFYTYDSPPIGGQILLYPEEIIVPSPLELLALSVDSDIWA